MVAADPTPPAADGLPLFVDDEALRARLSPRMGRNRFRAALRAAELRGFPRIRADWGGRYWPAVKCWLDEDNGVENNGIVAGAEDGREHFDVAPKRKARLQDRSSRPALLDREPDHPRSDGVSGQVHRLAPRGR